MEEIQDAAAPSSNLLSDRRLAEVIETMKQVAKVTSMRCFIGETIANKEMKRKGVRKPFLVQRRNKREK